MKKTGLFSTLSAVLALFVGLVRGGQPNIEPLKVGDQVPSVEAIDHKGQPFNPATFAASGWTLFFFYPKAFTPGCTAQSCSIRDDASEFVKRGIRPVGVSTDKAEIQARFVTEKKFEFPLVADVDQAVLKAFGMTGLAGFAKRGAFLAKDGKVVWVDPKGSTNNQSKAVLEAFDGLSSD